MGNPHDRLHNDHPPINFNADNSYNHSFPPQMPPAPYYHQPNAVFGPSKNLAVAAVLAFFLGGLGIHRFYLGKPISAIGMLALTIFGWLTLIILVGALLLFVVGIWAIVDFILILTKSGSFRNINWE